MAAVPTVANSASGHAKIVRWLHKQLAGQEVALANIHVVMEATNVYWEACAHHFHALGCTVSVVNPAQIKFFAKSTLRRGKTDAMDAQIIARFGLIMQPSAWQPSSPALVQIKQLVREREALLREHLREGNHLKALLQGQYATPLVVRLAKQRLRLMERHLAVIEAAIREAFACDVALQAQLDLLLSVPGFGFVTAATVLAETNGFETLTDGHQVAAYAGLAPAPNQSGHSNRRGTIFKMGNARLRRIAYEDFKRLLNAAKRVKNPHRELAILWTLWDSGVRASEFCNLKREDLDEGNLLMRVLGKGNRYQTVYIDPITVRAIQTYLRKCPTRRNSDRLFQRSCCVISS